METKFKNFKKIYKISIYSSDIEENCSSCSPLTSDQIELTGSKIRMKGQSGDILSPLSAINIVIRSNSITFSEDDLHPKKQKSYFNKTKFKRSTFSNCFANLKVHPFRSLIFSKNLNEKFFLSYLLSVYHQMQFFKQNLELVEIQGSYISIALPKLKNVNLKTLFLDLNETIGYFFDKAELDLNDLNSTKNENFRPYLMDFLLKLKPFYEIYIYSNVSSDQTYSIFKNLDPKKEIIDGFLTIDHCLTTKDEIIIKPLILIKNREIEKMVIVTSSIQSCYFNIENSIPIKPWSHDRQDRELKYLGDYLIEAYNAKDIREYNSANLKLKKLMNLAEEDIKKWFSKFKFFSHDDWTEKNSAMF